MSGNLSFPAVVLDEFCPGCHKKCELQIYHETDCFMWQLPASEENVGDS